MDKKFQQHKNSIRVFLEKFFLDKGKFFVDSKPWSTTVLRQLQAFCLQGKMLRGSLVLFSYSLFANDWENVVSVASALEVFHAGLLIHDDIMDEDMLRRGSPSVFASYQTLAKEKQILNEKHFGQSMGICVGDAAFFLGSTLLSNSMSNVVQQSLFTLFSTELTKVVFAQMQDIYHGREASKTTEEDILQVYRHKTGRYTFSLPFMAGAVAAHQHGSIVDQLAAVGENLGLLFQLKDDELGLFGTEERIGKPVGSDIRGNKKTLYWLYLFKCASKEYKDRLQSMFGNPDISKNDLDFIYDVIEKYNIKTKVKEQMDLIKFAVERQIDLLTIDENKKKIFSTLLEYSLTRQS